MSAERHRLGLVGEQAAVIWLEDAGWHVLARRHRTPQGELDVVAIDPDGTLVGVEVKLRRTSRAGSGAEAVDRRRVGRMRAALGAYAAGLPGTHTGLRLDLVEVWPASDAGLWHVRRHAHVDAW